LLIDEIEEENEAILSQVIGWTDILLDGERSQVRTSITNLGSLIAQAMVTATEADGAIINGGGIRTSIEAGEITRRDILNVLPFNNYVVLKEVKGSEILQALEYGVSAYPEQNGRFPQVAGIAFEFAPDREPGSRITEVTINGQELEPEKTYKIAVNDFIAAGGDGYTMLKDAPVLKEYGVLESMVAEYIKGNQYAQGN